MSLLALTFPGSGLSPSAEIMRPTYRTCSLFLDSDLLKIYAEIVALSMVEHCL